jgi:precorrin-6A/cobalt-precorrin-6A reductase
VTRLLILGGTAEAAALARLTAPVADTVTSLAGRTAVPADLPGRVRIGGFGGAEGLLDFLRAESIERVVDATHPFAARISAQAEAACAAAGIPRLVLARPMWPHVDGDHWIEAADMAEAALRVRDLGRRAFLAVGRQEAGAFADAGIWFLVRLLSPDPLPLPSCEAVIGRGPFRVEDETRLLAEHRIDVVVTKASGGPSTYAKIAAARALSLPVLMIRRPPPPAGPAVTDVADAAAWVSG